MTTRIVLIGYNRRGAMRRTVRSLASAISSARLHPGCDIDASVHAALDGPKIMEDGSSEAVRIHEVAAEVRRGLPDAAISIQVTNRGLPSVILEGLDTAFSAPEVDRAICVEDDVELAPTALAALLHASARLARPHVISAAPLRDGIPPNQCMLVTREAHAASRALLVDYIARFRLDGSYGSRDHRAILDWLAERAARHGLAAPTTTSQDAVRAFAWSVEGIAIHALPMRLVAHRGLRGQHNTPLHAIRTGGAFERLDRSPWNLLQPRLDAWISRGGGTDEVQLGASERILGAAARRAYAVFRTLRG